MTTESQNQEKTAKIERPESLNLNDFDALLFIGTTKEKDDTGRESITALLIGNGGDLTRIITKAIDSNETMGTLINTCSAVSIIKKKIESKGRYNPFDILGL